MTQKFITNAFSLNMLASSDASIRVTVTSCDLQRAQDLYKFHRLPSAVGHADTASVFSAQLGAEVVCARATVALVPGDWLLVGQYSGPRLPEGATTLPEGAELRWCIVEVMH